MVDFYTWRNNKRIASNELHCVSKLADKFPLFFPAVHTCKHEEVSTSVLKEKLYVQTLAQ